jgi:hypothetical protein
MCLDLITERRLFADPSEEWCWKQFRNGNWFSRYDPNTQDPAFTTSVFDMTRFTIGSWNRAKGFKDAHGFYRTGFYCYADQPFPIGISKAGFYITVPVLVRGIVTRGTLAGDRIVIARRLLIPLDWRERVEAVNHGWSYMAGTNA